MVRAEIYISLKETLSDPQGLTIKHALESLGYKGLESVRIGKLIHLRIHTSDKQKAKKEVEAMCRQLLANPVIEEYSFQVKEV